MTRPSFSRRTFLRGAAATVALPFLESLVPREARAGSPSPLRFLAFYIPNGVTMPSWKPVNAGPDYTLSPILASLQPVRDQVLVLSGLGNTTALGGAGHSSGTASFLTGHTPKETEGPDYQNAQSLDQVIAGAVGGNPGFPAVPSLAVGMDNAAHAVGQCDTGYNCVYSRNISWATPTQPVPRLSDPVLLFNRLFQGADSGLSAADAAKRLRRRTSVLDVVLGQANRLRAHASTLDQSKIDEHLAGLRDLEMRLQATTPHALCGPTSPPVEPSDFPGQVQMMLDLIVYAIQCDLTRVATFMLADSGSNRWYNFLNTSDSHHTLSHETDPIALAELARIDAWEVSQFVYLVKRLQSIDDGNGATLLDRSLLYFSSEISDGATHSHLDLPVLLAGRCGGAIRPGRHIIYPDAPSISDLFLTILAAYKIPTTKFGDRSVAPLYIG